MIKTVTFVQRAWEAALGVEEVIIVVRYRVRCTSEVPRRKSRARELVVHRGFRDLPLFRRRWVAWPRPLPPRAPARLLQAPPAKRSSHPKRITLAERKRWLVLRPGWDAGRPRHRTECRGDKRCPGCGDLVAMRVHAGAISCPGCKARVGYARGLNCSDWYWALAGQPGVIDTPTEIPQLALNRCRPCPWAGCRSHLYLTVDGTCGSLKLNHRRVPPDRMDEMEDTCAEDVAEREAGRVGLEPKLLPLEVVGRHLGLTLERARQIEVDALAELKFRETRREKREAG